MRRVRRLWVWIGALGTLWVGAPAAAYAQTFESGVKVGIAVTGLPHAGEVFDQVAGVTSRETSSKIGLTGGGYVRFTLWGRFGFQPEALFVMKGVKLEETGGGTLSARFNYLDVPLLVHFHRPINSETSGYLLAGPSFGIRLGSSATLDASGKTTDVDINPTRLDLGLAFGGGIEWGRYLLEMRFTGVGTDIADSKFTHADSLRNRTFSVLAGMKLPSR